MTQNKLICRVLICTLLFVFPLAAFSASPYGKTAREYLQENLSRAGNNHHCYEYTDLSDTKAPAGYTPFYVSHYGRHGSRSDFSDYTWKNTRKVLSAAAEQGILTPLGKEMLEGMDQLCAASAGMNEMLTPRGSREHMQIASRTFDRFPSAFKGSRKVNAVSSTAARCILSMGSFTTALAQKNARLQISLITGQRYMDYIGRTGDYHAATKGVGKQLDDYAASLPKDTVSILRNLFTDTKAARKLIGNVTKFQECYIIASDFGPDFDVDTDLYKAVPFQEIYNYWTVKNHSLYMKHGNSVEYGDRRVAAARQLVEDVVLKADMAIADGDVAADLRFGHDYPLLALAGYLGISGPGGRYSFDEVDDNFYGFFDICMASTLEIVFYRNKSGEVLVKCLYNERERTIPELAPVSGPYYRWEDVRNYWTGRYPEDKYPAVESAGRHASPAKSDRELSKS